MPLLGYLGDTAPAGPGRLPGDVRGQDPDRGNDLRVAQPPQGEDPQARPHAPGRFRGAAGPVPQRADHRRPFQHALPRAADPRVCREAVAGHAGRPVALVAVRDRMKPRAAYIHVPFCRRRCGYCNFTVVAGREDLIAAYLRGGRPELSAIADASGGRHAVFRRRHADAALPPAALRRLLKLAREWFPLADGLRIQRRSQSGGPGRRTAGRAAGSGVNRLSLGVQSFDDAKLEVLERDHRRSQLQRALELCRRPVRVAGHRI